MVCKNRGYRKSTDKSTIDQAVAGHQWIDQDRKRWGLQLQCAMLAFGESAIGFQMLTETVADSFQVVEICFSVNVKSCAVAKVLGQQVTEWNVLFLIKGSLADKSHPSQVTSNGNGELESLQGDLVRDLFDCDAFLGTQLI